MFRRSHDSTVGQSPRLPIFRTALAGVLMGLANLVPGVSGGTMVVVMNLYAEFVTSIAEVTRLHFTRRNVVFLVVLSAFALGAIATGAGTLSRAVTLHESAMFSLFIGLTLGGVPVLVRMVDRPNRAVIAGGVFGLALMLAVVATQGERPDKEAIRAAVEAGQFVVGSAFGRDLAAGILGMSAMVLPGISGAYMLLILGRYETILAAIALAKRYAFSTGSDGHPAEFLRVLIPFGTGAVLSLVVLSTFLKWLLQRYRDLTIGALVGILLGSVVGIWPFSSAAGMREIGVGILLAVMGFGATALLSRFQR